MFSRYWHYSVNQLGCEDMAAQISLIDTVKRNELRQAVFVPSTDREHRASQELSADAFQGSVSPDMGFRRRYGLLPVCYAILIGHILQPVMLHALQCMVAAPQACIGWSLMQIDGSCHQTITTYRSDCWPLACIVWEVHGVVAAYEWNVQDGNRRGLPLLHIPQQVLTPVEAGAYIASWGYGTHLLSRVHAVT